ncbi:uncharacterized protein LOC110739628 [Chenopodium quinoa]|uniref:uncharacterized protein LOC110739628 n=1 Tax=Chenopodium quinoa TaxID=63459 RepID=UPI000B76F5DF|nr:uncharacterized protein LOC110739628 [Chenopodium quinoa]
MAAHNHIPLPIGQVPSSPYYIHPSDMNSMQFVSNKFKDEGFTDWKRSMTISLSTKNKLGFVTGIINKPNLQYASYKQWERCNDMIISWIMYNLDAMIARSVLYFNIAAEIWKDLEDRYDSIDAFFTKMKMLWDELHLQSYSKDFQTTTRSEANAVLDEAQ